MKLWTCLFCALLSFACMSVQAEDNLNSIFENEEVEYCIKPESILLISGRLYMPYQDMLVPLISIRYTEEGVFAVPKASMILAHCPKCNKWYVAQFGHECKG